MKKIINNLLVITLLSVGFASCLKSVNSNVNGLNTTAQFIQLEYVDGGSGTVINSGMQYFSGATLLYAGTDLSDTANFTVTLNGPSTLSSDLTVTIKADAAAMNDNFANDGITYLAMPDSTFKLLTPTVVIKAGTRTASARIVFYPSKISTQSSYMLPLTVTNGSNVLVSGNFGHLYFHTIGNPIAGAYTWDFYRYNVQVGTFPNGPYSGGSFFGSSISLVPVTTTIVSVPTGYYTQPNYLISFTNTGGVLSNFSAQIDPAMLNAYFTAGGVTIVSAPVITTASNNTKFTIHYTVFNGASYRDVWDVYTKK